MCEKCDKFGKYSRMTARVLSEKFNSFSIRFIVILFGFFAFLLIFYKMHIDNSLLQRDKQKYSLFNSEFVEIRGSSVFIGWKNKTKKIKTYYTVEIPLKRRK